MSARYGTICARIAKNILKDPLDAEECVNDAYFGAWNTIPPQRPDPLQAYICRIVRNLAIKKYHAITAAKRNNIYDTALDELAACIPAASTVEGEYAARELAGALDRFLDTLDRRNRVMFVLRYWYAEPVAGIAERFHVSSHYVSVRLFRTRARLRNFLEKERFSI